MSHVMTFGNILDEVHKMPLEDQDMLREILSKRIREHRRNQLADEMREARAEYNAGQCRPISVDDLMNEIVT
jgi:riboflavin synthase